MIRRDEPRLIFSIDAAKVAGALSHASWSVVFQRSDETTKTTASHDVVRFG
jgi:hypothetical protein